MDKRDRATLFRQRLADGLTQSQISRSALARYCQVDRSTIAQLLNLDEDRLPNAHLAANCASALGVSSDWLLGLTDRRETASDLLDTSLRFTEANRTPADQQIVAWHQEAAGYKIRHVPTSIPDIFKTDAVLDFEYAAFLDRTPEQAGLATKDTKKWLREPGSDYEICMSVEQITSLVRGEGYWRDLAQEARTDQLRHIVSLCRDHYPSLRVYLYDDKKVFSSPITIFGPLLATVYIGRYYLVYREKRQVQALTDHFDQLIRDAETDARSIASKIENML